METKKFIVQFGRLDVHYRNEINFSFGAEEGSADLTSSFLMRTNALQNAKRLIIFPSSIILQDHILSSEDEFIKKIADVDLGAYFNNPATLLAYHPQVNGSDLLVVASKGYYTFKGEQYRFNASLDLITLQIYLHLISKFSFDSIEEIYIDVSSGLNIHIAALMNAMYRYIPFMKFKRFFKSTNEKVSAFILSSDPILGKPTTPISIQMSSFQARAFNSFPYKDPEPLCKLIRQIFRDKEYKKDLQKLISKEYFLLHGSLIYGAPLTLMLADNTVLKRMFVEIGTEQILKDLRLFYANAIDDLEVNSFDIYALTYTLEIAKAIYFHFDGYIEQKEIEFGIGMKENGKISINNRFFDETFEVLHNQYGQPPQDYKGEINKHLENIRSNGSDVSQFTSFASLLVLHNPTYKNNPVFNPRNFLAHGGLENNITEISVTEDKATIRYNADLAESKRDSIIKYIKK